MKLVSFSMPLLGSASFKGGKEPGNWTQKQKKTKQNGTLFDHLVNSEIGIFAASQIY